MADVTQAVLIPGCWTGIGRATAEQLAGQGHTDYAGARRPGAIEDLRASGCRTIALDVTDESSMRTAVEAVEEGRGRGWLMGYDDAMPGIDDSPPT